MRWDLPDSLPSFEPEQAKVRYIIIMGATEEDAACLRFLAQESKRTVSNVGTAKAALTVSTDFVFWRVKPKK